MTDTMGLSPSVVVGLLQKHEDGIRVGDLIDRIVKRGYDVDLAVRTLRSMLNRGDIGLGPEMDIRLLKELA